VIITSNRDEKADRPLALAPQKYFQNKEILYYPKDPRAGGSWFVVKPNGDALVLLNGAEKEHKSLPVYRKCRGVVLLEIASCKNILEAWRIYDLQNIEPFTLVVFSRRQLYQFRWNGIEKCYIELDRNTPHIWSSSTLYSEEVRRDRERWFQEFLHTKRKEISANDIFNFHAQTQKEDQVNGLIINREDVLKTKSITQCVLGKNEFTINHKDLVSKKFTIFSKAYE
jgi:uncharacterized protein with NRDE domain